MDKTRSPSAPDVNSRVTPLELIRRFRADRDGVTSVEFAMVSVPFFGTLFAVLETAFAFFASQTLETALADSARQILTGQAQGNAAITSATQFRDQVMCNGSNTMLPSFIDCSQVKVDIRTVTSFSAADLARPDYQTMTMQYDPGAAGSIVVVRAVYPLPVYVSLLGTQGTVDINGRRRILFATATFRNEPF